MYAEPIAVSIAALQARSRLRASNMEPGTRTLLMLVKNDRMTAQRKMKVFLRATESEEMVLSLVIIAEKDCVFDSAESGVVHNILPKLQRVIFSLRFDYSQPNITL